MALVFGGLNVLTKSFNGTVLLHRCLRPSTCMFDNLRWFATEKHKTVLDERPKKPTPPLFMYHQSVRERLKQENPGKKLTELVSLATAEYKQLSEDKKEELQRKYEERLAEYKKEYSKFMAGCSKTELEKMAEEKKERRVQRKKMKLRKEKKQLDKPKRPAGSFLRFFLERRQADVQSNPERIKNMKVAEYAKEIGELWKNMSDKEKKPYHDKFEADQAEYEKKLENWETKMANQDKMYLVRVRHKAEAEGASKKIKVTSKKTARKTTTKKKTTKAAAKKKSITTKKKATRK